MDDMESYGISLKEMQLLAYFIAEKGYTLVAIQQRPNDLWLVKARNRRYPILHLCEQSDAHLARERVQLRQVHRALCDLIHRESKVVVINVHADAHTYEDAYVHQIAFGDHLDADFLHMFPQASERLVAVSDEQAEKARLARVLETSRSRGSFLRERTALLPRYALILCALVLLVTLLTMVVAASSAPALGNWQLLRPFLDQMTLGSWVMLLQLPALFTAAMLCDGLYHRGTLFIAGGSVMLSALFQVMSGSEGSASIAAMAVGLWCAGLLDIWMARAYRHPLIRRQLLRQLFWIVVAVVLNNGAWITIFGGVLGALLSALCCGKGSFQRNVRRHAFAAVAALVTVVGIWMATSAGEWQAVWEHAGAVEHIQDYTAYDQN